MTVREVIRDGSVGRCWTASSYGYAKSTATYGLKRPEQFLQKEWRVMMRQGGSRDAVPSQQPRQMWWPIGRRNLTTQNLSLRGGSLGPTQTHNPWDLDSGALKMARVGNQWDLESGDPKGCGVCKVFSLRAPRQTNSHRNQEKRQQFKEHLDHTGRKFISQPSPRAQGSVWTLPGNRDTGRRHSCALFASATPTPSCGPTEA